MLEEAGFEGLQPFGNLKGDIVVLAVQGPKAVLRDGKLFLNSEATVSVPFYSLPFTLRGTFYECTFKAAVHALLCLEVHLQANTTYHLCAVWGSGEHVKLREDSGRQSGTCKYETSCQEFETHSQILTFVRCCWPVSHAVSLCSEGMNWIYCCIISRVIALRRVTDHAWKM